MLRISLVPGCFRWWVAALAYVGGMFVLVGLSFAGLPPQLGQMVVFAGYVLLACLIALLFAAAAPGRTLGLASSHRKISILLISVLAAGATFLLAEIGAQFDENVSESTEKLLSSIGLGAGDQSDFFIILTICCLAPLGEEALYRGLIFKGIFDSLSRLNNPLSRPRSAAFIAAVVSAALFAFSHGGEGQETSVVFVIGLSGIIFGLSYAISGSLWTAVMAHSFNNTLVLAIAAQGAANISMTNKLAILLMPVVTWCILWLWTRVLKP